MAEQIPLYMADSGKFQKMLPTDTLPASIVAWSNPSIGVFADTAPAIVDNGNGTVTVGATVVALATATTVGATIAKFAVAGATFTIPADSQTYYICAKYSANTASYYLEALEGNINARTITPVYACWNILGAISSQYFGSNGDILANKIDFAQVDTVPYRRSIAGGLIITEASLVWSTTAATIYAGTTPIALSAMTASSANLLKAYHVAGVWTYSVGAATYDNTNYDNGTALVALGTNTYAVRWIFRSVSNPAQLMYVCGTAYYSTYDAAAAELMRTDLPELITKHCILVGKAIVQSGASAGVTVSTFDVSFAGGAISSDHNSLGGIYGDSPFYHLSLPAYTQVNNVLALTGTGLLKLTAGVPSIDSTSYLPTTGGTLTGALHISNSGYLDLLGGIWLIDGSGNAQLNSLTLLGDLHAASYNAAFSTIGVDGLATLGSISTGTIHCGTVYGGQLEGSALCLDYSGDTHYNALIYAGKKSGSTTCVAYIRGSGGYGYYEALGFFTPSGTNLGFLKADGSTDYTTYLTATGNIATATKLATARTIAATGDGAWSVSFDGSAAVSSALTLASIITAGSSGSATSVPAITWDAKGRLTAVAATTISIPHTQINDWSTATASYLTANQSISLTGVVTGSGTTSIATSIADGALSIAKTSGLQTALNSYLPLAGGTITGGIYGLNEFCNLNGNSSTTYYYLGSLAPSGSGGYYHLTVKIQGGDWTQPGGVIVDFNLYGNSPKCVYAGMGTFRAAFVCYYNTTSTNYDFYYKPTFGNWSVFGISSTLLTSGTIYKMSASQLSGGNTTAPVGTLTAISTTNWVDQAVSTTSLPTFAGLNLSMGSTAPFYAAAWAAYPSTISFFGAVNANTTAATNGIIMSTTNVSLLAVSSIDLYVAGVHSIACTSNLTTIATPLTVSGLITANGGITGSLTGTASNASALGSVAADHFVQGSGTATWGVRTTGITGAVTQGLKSGFYDADGTTGTGTPTGGWCHQIVNAHIASYSGNQYQGMLSIPFWSSDLYIKGVALGIDYGWNKVLHSSNYSNYAIPLTGSSAITGALVSTSTATFQQISMGLSLALADSNMAWVGRTGQNTSTLANGILFNTSGGVSIVSIGLLATSSSINLSTGNSYMSISDSRINFTASDLIFFRSRVGQTYDTMSAAGNVSNTTNITYTTQTAAITIALVAGAGSGFIKTIANYGTNASAVLVSFSHGSASIPAGHARMFISYNNVWAYYD